jgi:hypothetical protein
MIGRLFKRYGPGRTTPLQKNPGEKDAPAIARQYGTGFEAVIPDGAGGTKTLLIIPMAG